MISTGRRLTMLLLATGMLAVLIGLHPAKAQAVAICVDGSGAADPGTGACWTTPYRSLQSALAAAQPGDEIWVAQGIYTPGVETGSTFSITSGISLYGGFAATETLRTQRDWTANVTVLSGDIGGDDHTDAHGVVTMTTNIVGGNAAHVVWVDGVTAPVTGATHLDGFVITAGWGSPTGGGLYCDGAGSGHACSPAIANVGFSGNSASSGGAMYNNGANSGASSPTLTNVVFISNTCSGDGGAMYNNGDAGASSPSLTNVVFRDNQGNHRGGAIANYSANGGVSSPTLTNVIFSGQHSTYGGALYNYSTSGGVSGPSLANAVFTGNSAAYGGALYNSGYNGESIPALVNVTFSANTASVFGGAISNSGPTGISRPTLANAILWGNTAPAGPEIYDESPAVTTVRYSIVQGGWSGTGNRDADPLFVDATGGNVQLMLDSPAIDAGTNVSAPETDVRDLPRPVNFVADMGAYELQAFDLAITGGSPQTATAGSAFVNPLTVQVSSKYGEAVGPGAAVTFTPPASGPGLNSTGPFTTVTDAYGVVTATVTANNLAGSYQVAVTARGVVTPVLLTLVNDRWPVTTVITAGPNPSLLGQLVTFTATVSPLQTGPVSPTGVVTFTVDNVAPAAVALDGNGTAAFAANNLPAGQHIVVAMYGGDARYLPRVSTAIGQIVQPLPAALNDAASTLQGEPVAIPVLANDIDEAGGGLAVVSIPSPPGHGTATIAPDGQTVNYTPTVEFSGEDTLVYVAEDANGNTDAALVAIVVSPGSSTNTPPQIAPVSPEVAVTLPFTGPGVDVNVQLPPSFYPGVVGEQDNLFLSFTSYYTPTENTNTPPTNLKFGNYEFDLTLYLNGVPQHDVQFAVPITLTIGYDPARLGDLAEVPLEVFAWDGAAWSKAGITVVARDLTNHTITLELTHLTKFAFFAAAPTGLDPGSEPDVQEKLFLPVLAR